MCVNTPPWCLSYDPLPIRVAVTVLAAMLAKDWGKREWMGLEVHAELLGGASTHLPSLKQTFSFSPRKINGRKMQSPFKEWSILGG